MDVRKFSKKAAQMLSIELSCGKCQNNFSVGAEIFMGLISFLPAFQITFWNQWRKPSMKQEELYQGYVSNVSISIQDAALCDQSYFNQLLHWQGLNSSSNSEEASQKDSGGNSECVALITCFVSTIISVLSPMW